jgi:hypothetical protein
MSDRPIFGMSSRFHDRGNRAGFELGRLDCRQKTLDLLLQALRLFCEFAGRTEDQFGGSSHLARGLGHACNVLHDALSALCGLMQLWAISLVDPSCSSTAGATVVAISSI